MKIKKRQFARLKDITEEVNTCGAFGLAGIKLDKLIADIESAQKVKTVQEKPIDFMESIFNKHRKYIENDFIKQGASSYDPNIPFTRGLRDAVEALAEPKIGDVGYFWNDKDKYSIHAKLEKISDGKFKYGFVINDINDFSSYPNFSKTPPELR